MRSSGFAQRAGLAPKGPLPARCARRSARARPFRPLSERRRQSDSGRWCDAALASLRLTALLTASLWITLLVFLNPTRAETVDAGKVYVIDGDTVAVARERIRRTEFRHPGRTAAAWRTSPDSLPEAMPRMTAKSRAGAPRTFGARQFMNA